MNAKTTYLWRVAILVAALVVPTAASGGTVTPQQLEAPTLSQFDAGNVAAKRTTILTTAPRRLAALSWWGGTYTVTSGEKVTVYVSTTYAEAETVARQWAEFFARLPHGSELSMVRAYIAPLDEVQEMCWSDGVVGCYGVGKLVTVGDSSAGVPPASVAIHEYGHHIAANRINAPWAAIDWGTKRWASYMNICPRAQTGTVFPGDEGMNYSFNPGEAFAESYRVLVETNGTALGYDWPIIDPSFRPDVQALTAVREDVLHPWSGSTTKTISGKFLRRSRTWTTQVATPLDGDLRLRVTVPGGGANDVTLLSGDGRTVLATGSWDSSGGKSVQHRVCGARSVKVRVTRGGAATRFTLRAVIP
jgi:hypothetical protein